MLNFGARLGVSVSRKLTMLIVDNRELLLICKGRCTWQLK